MKVYVDKGDVDNWKFLQDYTWKSVHIILGDVSYYNVCTNQREKG